MPMALRTVVAWRVESPVSYLLFHPISYIKRVQVLLCFPLLGQ